MGCVHLDVGLSPVGSDAEHQSYNKEEHILKLIYIYCHVIFKKYYNATVFLINSVRYHQGPKGRHDDFDRLGPHMSDSLDLVHIDRSIT